MESGLVLLASIVVAFAPIALVVCGKKKAASTPSKPPAKNAAGAAAKMPAAAKAPAVDLKPKQVPLNEKEAMIAKGQKKGAKDYPTMEDVVSDWSSSGSNGKKKEGTKKDKKSKKEKKSKKNEKSKNSSSKDNSKEDEKLDGKSDKN
ncbi:hypothetical protein QR680_006556 [Steinernema hermaphroditum]|uniref:Uncharacterized protein n=1 Tax=Steinernema hermaphroditum TaxID=289476 RepID=A0AA39HVT8_9BILA|nr:hypothetical protein QR680_006556 [Steinernema hermaphroditum]